MDKILWIVLALLAGACLPVQGGLNTRLGQAAANPVAASMISFIVGTTALVLYIVITSQTISWVGLKNAPPQAWLGGLLGAFCLTVIILAFPRLGPGLTFGLLVAGQMIISAVLEHYGVLVAQAHPISFLRIVGIVLVVAGVIIIRRF